MELKINPLYLDFRRDFFECFTLIGRKSKKNILLSRKTSVSESKNNKLSIYDELGQIQILYFLAGSPSLEWSKWFLTILRQWIQHLTLSERSMVQFFGAWSVILVGCTQFQLLIFEFAIRQSMNMNMVHLFTLNNSPIFFQQNLFKIRTVFWWKLKYFM